MNLREIAAGLVLGLLANELFQKSGWAAMRIVILAARVWPASSQEQADRAEEWPALVNDRPGQLMKLGTALGFLCGAVFMSSRLKLASWLSHILKRISEALRSYGRESAVGRMLGTHLASFTAVGGGFALASLLGTKLATGTPDFDYAGTLLTGSLGATLVSLTVCVIYRRRNRKPVAAAGLVHLWSSSGPRPTSQAEVLLESALARRTWANGRVWNGVYHPRSEARPLTFDLCWPNERLIVELDGPEHRTATKFAADRRRDVELGLDGFTVVRFTNEQVQTALDETVTTIENVLRARTGST